MDELLYTVTVYPISDQSEEEYDSHELGIEDNSSAEVAMSHIQQMILDDPLAHICVPTKLFVVVERSDGDSCHASMSLAYEDEEVE